jgi:isopentenyl diphosphate isomerase/L-lactate dehydrogenase-like FMN-dependent dehydrogenase
MQPINLFDYEVLAQPRLDPNVWDYYQGGSDDEVTLRANRAAFERIWLRPRMLVNVHTIDMQTSVLGMPVPMPILVAPTSQHGLAHPEGECETARGVGATGTVMVLSTSASRVPEDVAHAAGTRPLWFQLYLRSYTRGEDLVRRVEALGYRAIVLTTDLPRMGNRERDTRHGLAGDDIRHVLRTPNYDGDEGEIGDTLTWDVLDWLRSITTLPIVVKGILTAEDALLAVERGASGIVVSNHGGRQLDGATPSVMALPEIVSAVEGRCEIYLDGGIRRGTDVLKALALGARAVLIGRPILWGLAANGAAGVTHVLDILRSELELAMALSGCPTIPSITSGLIDKRSIV